MGIIEIELEKLKIHPKNIRTEYEGIDELAQSIKENGIMQNLTVVPEYDYYCQLYGTVDTPAVKKLKEVAKESGCYLVVIGNRRLTAARKAGLKTAPCMIVDSMSVKDQIATMLTENMNRKDLKIYEEAAAIQMCFEDFGFKMETLEEKTGLSRTTIHHRLNIAKLDKKALKKAAEDSEFQLTFNDLYALEKIEDVNTRNKVLKESRNSADLANKARLAATDELREKNKKAFIKIAKEAGLTPAPKEAENNLWYGDKWEHIKEYDLFGKIPKKLQINDKEAMYIARYNTFYIIKKKSKNKKEEKLTKEQQRAREIDKARRETKALYRILFKDMGSFIRDNIFKGINKLDDENKEIFEGSIWKYFIEYGVWVTMNQVRQALLGENMWSNKITPQMRTDAENEAKELPALFQKISVAYWSISDCDPTNYDGSFNKNSAEKVTAVFKLLTLFGYSWPDEEAAQLVSGDHELYRRYER